MEEMPLIADTYPFMMDTVVLLFIVPTRLHNLYIPLTERICTVATLCKDRSARKEILLRLRRDENEAPRQWRRLSLCHYAAEET